MKKPREYKFNFNKDGGLDSIDFIFPDDFVGTRASHETVLAREVLEDDELKSLREFANAAKEVVEFYGEYGQWNYDKIRREDYNGISGGKRARALMASDVYKKVFGGEKE